MPGSLHKVISYLILLNPYDSPVRYALLFPLYSWGNYSSERLSNLPKVELRYTTGLSDYMYQAALGKESTLLQMRNDLKLPRAPHLTFVQYISTFPSPLTHTNSCRPDLSRLELASWNVRDSICRLREGCQVKGGVKKGSHPEGSPGPMKSTSLGLCVRRVKGEDCLPVCMPPGQRVGPGFPFAPSLRGLSRQPSNQEILLLPESQLLLKTSFFYLKNVQTKSGFGGYSQGTGAVSMYLFSSLQGHFPFHVPLCLTTYRGLH